MELLELSLLEPPPPPQALSSAPVTIKLIMGVTVKMVVLGWYFMVLNFSLATALHGAFHGWGGELISSAHQGLGRTGIVGICFIGFSDGNLKAPPQLASKGNKDPRSAALDRL